MILSKFSDFGNLVNNLLESLLGRGAQASTDALLGLRGRGGHVECSGLVGEITLGPITLCVQLTYVYILSSARCSSSYPAASIRLDRLAYPYVCALYGT